MLRRRLQRLMADQQKVQQAFADHAYVKIQSTEGEPAERYQLLINVPGFREEESGKLKVVTDHLVDIILPAEYPRRAPFCRMLSPVYHPNIDPQRICIGDHWSAAESLPQLVIRIAEMICFQSYNVKSPLNAKAAAWTEENLDRLPLSSDDIESGR